MIAEPTMRSFVSIFLLLMTILPCRASVVIIGIGGGSAYRGPIIEGPSSIIEGGSASYQSFNSYYEVFAGSWTVPIVVTNWTVNSPFATITTNGFLTTSDVPANTTVEITFQVPDPYWDATTGIMRTARKSVRIVDRPVPVADFSGDDHPDVLLQSTNEVLNAWVMNQTNKVGEALLHQGTRAWNWRAFGTGDVNGDNKVDVLLQNKFNNGLSVWYMNGSNYVGAAYLRGSTAPSLDWRAVAAADFNGDRKPDILFQHRNSTAAVWLMNGTTCTNGLVLRNGIGPGTGWRIAGVADFSGDGHNDILWQHRNGQIALWRFVNLTFVGSNFLRSGPAETSGWTIAGTVDANQDGKPDILWSNPTGQTMVWLMDDTAVRFSTPFPILAPGWSVVGPK